MSIRTLSTHALVCTLFITLMHASATASTRYQPTDKMRMETRYVVQNMEQIHYANKSITDIDSKEFIKRYINEYDPNHLFFTQPEVDTLYERFAAPMTFYLRQGNLFPAFEIFDLYKQQADKRITWIETHLDQPISLEKIEYYTPDRKDLPWPATEQDADKLWEKRLKYELLNEVLSDTAETPEDSNAPISWKEIDQFIERYYNRVQTRPTPAEVLSHLAPEEDNVYYILKNPSQLASPEKTYDEKVADAKESLRKRYQRLRKMLGNIEPSEVQEIFLTTFTQMYDPHSNFLSADSMEEFSIAMHNSLVGIGAVLSEEDGVCVIKELLPGGPAEKSKLLHADDKIVGVAQGNGPMVDVMGLKLRKIVKKIRGKKGTKVSLLVWPGGSDPSKRITVTLTRDEIKLTTNLAEAQLFDIQHDGVTTKVGVVDLPTFYGSGDPASDDPSTTRDVKELIEKLKANGMEGLILDLRRNGGGLLSEAINLTGLFISTGPVVQVKNTIGQLNEYIDSDPRVTWSGPLIVLVSRYSASASEIVAGALKTSNRAIIVGDETTHGKGTVQAIFEIDRSILARLTQPKMGAAKITIQKWYLPDGNSTQLRGVQSDIILPSINPYLSIGESDLPNALEWDSIRPLPWHVEDFGLITDVTKEKLGLRSKERQTQLKEFVYLNENIDWFRSKREQKKFSLNYYQRQIDKDLDEHVQEEQEKKLKELSQNKFKNESIYLDSRLENEKETIKETKNDENEENDEKLDIHLREALRIMADWIELLEEPNIRKKSA